MRIENFSKLIKYYGKGRKIKLLGFFMLSLIAGFLEFAGIALVYPFILLVIKPETVIFTKYYKDFIMFTHQENILVNAFILGFLLMFVFIFKNVFMLYCSYLQNKFISNWKLDVNKKFLYYYLFSPYKNSLETSPSEKIYKLNFLINQTFDGFVFRTLHLVTNAVIVAMILGLLFTKFAFAAFVTALFVLLCLWGYKKLFKEKMSEISRAFFKFSAKCNDSLIEIINNLKEVKILGAENYFYEKYSSEQAEYNKILLKNGFYSSAPPYLVEIFVIFALIVLAGIISIQNAEDTAWMIASYTVVTAAIFRITPALNRIQVSLTGINGAREFAKTMVNEYEKLNLDFIQEKNISKIEFKDSIKLSNVSFAYKTKPVIQNLTLEIKKGEFVGIIGASGAGKSTLSDILMGLLPINEGEIRVDENAVTQNEFAQFRKLIGYVPQQINVFDGSFKRNIAWGMDEDKISEKRVIEVLKQAKLWNFVNGFEHGINTNALVGSYGLSQGQKQRLAIARALYKNPEVLIFDEATSSLDVETEHDITKMLLEMKGEKTIIAIAHRLSTLKSCDKLVYIKDGRVVDTGSFEELSQKHADFERFVKLSSLNNF